MGPPARRGARQPAGLAGGAPRAARGPPRRAGGDDPRHAGPDRGAAAMSESGHSQRRPRRRLADASTTSPASPAIRACGWRSHPEAWSRVDASRDADRGDRRALRRGVGEGGGRRPVLEYGVTTGFGEFKNVPIAPDCLEQLQRNILLSHSVGVGETADPDNPANYFEPDVVRAALAIRLNAFLKGHSGIRRALVRAVQAMLNRGDRAARAHPRLGGIERRPLPALPPLRRAAGGEPVLRRPRAGRLRRMRPASCAPGCSTSRRTWACEVPRRATRTGWRSPTAPPSRRRCWPWRSTTPSVCADTADGACALTLEAVCGCARAFDARVHQARGLAGQIASAANVRARSAAAS